MRVILSALFNHHLNALRLLLKFRRATLRETGSLHWKSATLSYGLF